ncbi:MAG TPA: ABC transporter permease, partial [candidate division Zixibacteria bacterium]|nr:ABC transporter permease [candidate division Zixibacteria bacterium]
MTTSEIKDGIMMAFQALVANKLRAFLTILGVLIGVSSVMAMVSVIQGLNDSMSGQIQSLGSNIIYVSKNELVSFGNRTDEQRNRPGITLEDAIAIKELCPGVGAVSPENHYWSPGGNQVKYRNNEARRPAFVGVMPDYEIVNNSFVTEGRFFTESDVHFKAYVCVIGYDVREALFSESEDPIGKEVTANGDKFTVVGVMEKKRAFLGESQNNFVVIPYGTFKKLHPEEIELSLAVRPRTPELIDKAIDEIEDVMRRRRGVQADKPNNFAVSTQEDLMDIYKKITAAIYGVMVLISSIGLFVGGVGVMNIMLVTVTERTREIGIRKAIGAKRRNILWQFLIEAMT